MHAQIQSSHTQLQQVVQRKIPGCRIEFYNSIAGREKVQRPDRGRLKEQDYPPTQGRTVKYSDNRGGEAVSKFSETCFQAFVFSAQQEREEERMTRVKRSNDVGCFPKAAWSGDGANGKKLGLNDGLGYSCNPAMSCDFGQSSSKPRCLAT